MKPTYLFLLFLSISTVSRAQEVDTCLHLSEITVTGLTGKTRIKDLPSPVSVMSFTQLESHFSTNVIDAIALEPGMSQITTGAGISKPVVRGLGYNRLLLVNDGVRQEGQQWGDEHGIEIDDHAISSVEILKGPASLMYGSDAMAGVLIFHNDPLLMSGELHGELMTGYQTNNDMKDVSAHLSGNQNGFVWSMRASGKWAGEYSNSHNHDVHNSQFREHALNGMVGLQKGWGHSLLRVSTYYNRPGIIEEGDEAPFQRVKHFKAVLDNSLNVGDGSLKAIVGYQRNSRKEFEEADECGLSMLLHTMSYDVRYVSPITNGWKYNAGIGGMWQQNNNRGDEYLIPDYNLFDAGVFATVSKDIDRLHLNGGVRFDNRHLSSKATEDVFTAFSRDFTGLTGSIGVIYNLLDNLDLRLNVARGFRAPNLSELGSNGVHEGTFRYEKGNSDLNPEFSWQFDMGLDFTTDFFSTSVALFANRINNYIYAQKNGEMVDGVPVYCYTQGDARILGGEATIIIHPIRHLHWENAFSYVNSVQMNQPAEAKYLPLTPAPRWVSTLHYDIKGKSRLVRNMFAEIEVDVNFRQNHYYKVEQTETATPSYTLVNLTAGTDVMSRGKRLFSFYLSCHNLFNRSYFSHLNRLKDMDLYDMGRNLCMKLVVPMDF